MNATLTMRPADPDDEPFLRNLRAQVDSERLGLQLWDETQKKMAQSILDMQFKAHNMHYNEVKAGWETKDNIIELNGQPIGRFIVTGDKHEIRLCDIVIDSQFRGMGLGNAVIETTKNECAESNRPLRLHVDKWNQVALQFYQNHGFIVIEDIGTHFFMEWDPRSPESKPTYFFPKNIG